MAFREWDAYSSLNIMSRHGYGMTCVGTNRYGERCRWNLGERLYDIRALLDAMEGRPPNEAIELLEELARLSLCTDWGRQGHQYQAGEVISRWESAIMEAVEEYENRMGLRRRTHVVEENWGRVEAETEELKAEIERLRVQLANEQVNSTSMTNRYRTTQQRYEDQEKRTEEYRRALLECERKVGNLKEENAEISRQLAVEKVSLELARRQCEENSATSNVRSSEYQESLSQKAQTIERTTAERDKLRAELVTLESQLNQLNEQSIHMGQEIDRATTERLNLSMQVENLTRELDLESKASSKYQSDLLQTQTHRDTLTKEVDNLRSQLDMERQKSSELVLGLEQAETSHTTLSNEKGAIQSRLESKCQEFEELTAELSQLKTNQATHPIETEALRIELASEHETSARLHQELSTTKEDLSITELALEEARASLKTYQRDNDKLQAEAADREKEYSDAITTLTNQIDFSRSHPFKTFSTTLIDIFKRRAKVVTGFKRNVKSSKRVVGANGPEVSLA